MILRVQTNDPKLAKKLLADDVSASSGSIVLSNDCKVTPQQPYEPSSGMIDVPQVLEFGVLVGTSIGCGVLAAWIYDLLKNRGAKVEINGKDLSSEPAKVELITAIVTEEMTVAEDS